MPHYTFQSSRVRRNVMGMRLLICPLLYPTFSVPNFFKQVEKELTAFSRFIESR